MRKHTHIVCGFFLFAIDVLYSLWEGCDFLNHNSTFEKINLIIQRKRKKTTKHKLFNKYNAIYKEITQKIKDRSKKITEHNIITFLFIPALFSDFFLVSLIRTSPFFLGRKERIEEGMV